MASKKISQLPSGSVNIPLTGQTAVVYSGITHQQTLSSLRQTLVDSGSHFYTGSQYINGNLIVTGSITAQEYIISSSVSHITVQTVSGSSNFGDTLNDNHNFTGSVKITGSITASYFVGNGSRITNLVSGSSNLIAYFSGSNYVTGSKIVHLLADGETLSIGSENVNPYYPERLLVSNEHFNIASFISTLPDGYAEVNILNLSTGSNSSTDLVIWNDQTTESSSYVDLGLNSSNYNAGGVGYGGDGYLINAANDMYIGSMDTMNHGHLHLFGGNLWNTSSISVYNDGTIGFGTDWLDNTAVTIPSSEDGYVYEFSGSVKLDNDLKVDGIITLPNYNSHPLNAPTGSIYFNFDDGHFYGYDGNTWKQLDN